MLKHLIVHQNKTKFKESMISGDNLRYNELVEGTWLLRHKWRAVKASFAIHQLRKTWDYDDSSTTSASFRAEKLKKRKEKLSNGELVKRRRRKNKFLVFPLLSFLTADTDFLDKFKHVHLWQRGESQEISLVSTGLYLVSLVFLRPISAPGNSFSQFKISSKTNKIWRTNHLFDIWWCEYAILPK